MTSVAGAKLSRVAPDKTAASLAARIEALADALRAAGVPPERAAAILAAAAQAALDAVTLDARAA